MMWGHEPGMGGWPAALLGLGMVVSWAAVIVCLVVVIRLLVRPTTGPSRTPPPGPETTLAERFARGDIDAEEYRARLATVRENQRPG